jgi:amino acid transporter
MVAKQFGESKGWTWTLFVVASVGIGIGGIMAIIDLNGTANKTPIIVGAVVLALLIIGFFLLTVKAISEHSKASDGI